MPFLKHLSSGAAHQHSFPASRGFPTPRGAGQSRRHRNLGWALGAIPRHRCPWLACCQREAGRQNSSSCNEEQPKLVRVVPASLARSCPAVPRRFRGGWRCEIELQGGLPGGLPDSALKCDLSSSTLPLLKEVSQQKRQHPGIREEDLPVMYPGKEENSLVRRQRFACSLWTCFSPRSTPSFGWKWNRANNSTKSNLISKRHKFSCLQIISQAGSTFLKWK